MFEFFNETPWAGKWTTTKAPNWDPIISLVESTTFLQKYYMYKMVWNNTKPLIFWHILKILLPSFFLLLLMFQPHILATSERILLPSLNRPNSLVFLLPSLLFFMMSFFLVKHFFFLLMVVFSSLCKYILIIKGLCSSNNCLLLLRI